LFNVAEALGDRGWDHSGLAEALESKAGGDEIGGKALYCYRRRRNRRTRGCQKSIFM
jgi:hypothetical protein